MKHRPAILALSLALTLGLSAPVAAAPDRTPEGAPRIEAVDQVAPNARIRGGSRSGISLDQAASIARDRFGGRVIRAETQRRDDGSAVHVIRLLQDNGRVRIVRVDAQSGRIID